MERQTFLRLLDRYLNGSASPEEQRLLEEYYKRLDEKSNSDLTEQEEEALHYALFQQIQQGIAHTNKVRDIRPKRRIYRWIAAASILIAVSTGGYFLLKTEPVKQVATTQDKIVPGSNKATLTLANGQKIDLNAAKSGKIATEAQAAINKTADGQLAYQSASNTESQVQYNTLSTPIGGRYELTLADGTKVLLDAESSITYPVAFIGNNRKVKLTGQAYFAVKHDAKHPFSIETSRSTIEDIGTEFNVNTYQDEDAEKTTLIEGAVAVNHKNLRPGQQAQVRDNTTLIKKADVESVIAWKENNFMFRGQSLRTTMQQIARWYNVSVKYDIDPDQIRIGGGISRTRQLDAVLDLMTGTGLVKFKLKERTITVYQ